MVRAYGQYQHHFGEQLTAYTGLHLQYFGLNDEIAVEPRLGARYKLNNRNTFNLGLGLHSQIQPKVIYFAQTWDSISLTSHKTNGELSYTRSSHFVLGYDHLFNQDFRIGIKLNGKRASQEWAIDLQNLTGFQSIFMEAFVTLLLTYLITAIHELVFFYKQW